MKIERVQQIYGEIEGYSITLAADPASKGPKYLQDQIATCRNFVNNVSRILLEVHRERHTLATTLHALQTMFEIESDKLLSEDERVRHLPSFNDRKAAINLVLREKKNEIASIESEIQDLEYVEKAVRHRHRELRDTMAEIKLQRSLVRDELDTGSFYGDERPSAKNGRGVSHSDEDDMNAEDIEALLQGEKAKAIEAAEAIEAQNVSAPETEAEAEADTKEAEPEPAFDEPSSQEVQPEPDAPDPGVASMGSESDTEETEAEAIQRFMAGGEKKNDIEEDFSDVFAGL